MNSKRINIVDKIKTIFRKFMGYKEGKKFTIDTEPIYKKYTDIELMKLATVEEKLKKAINQNSHDNMISKGINKDEAESLLQWVVQNAREAFTKENKEPLKDADLLGWCGFGQGITAITLQNMGLSPNIANANPTLNDKAGRHAFLTVEIPIIQSNGDIKNIPYLVDTTYRQFFLREEVTTSCGEYIKDRRFGNKVAPLAGYWVLQMPKGKKFAETILSKGFIELTEENAKIYGDSFTLEEKNRKDNTKVPTKKERTTGISGKIYIKNMLKPFEEEIDFYEGEIEALKINTKTPRMLKEKINSLGKKCEKATNSNRTNEIESISR